MATYDLEEQEQIEELKTWWKLHGTGVTAVVVILSLAVVSWQGWSWWSRQQAQEASVLYGALQQAAMQKEAKRSRDLAGELIDKYSSTSYAGMAALVSARVQMENGDAKTGRAQLAWAADKASDAELRDLARLRLAASLLEEKSYDDAMKALATAPAAPFMARYAEVRGDILAAQGKGPEAKSAYEAAEAAHTAPSPYRDMLQVKLDAVMGTK